MYFFLYLSPSSPIMDSIPWAMKGIRQSVRTGLGCFPLAITPVGRYTSSLFFCCLKTDMQQSIDPLIRRTSSWFLNTVPCEQTASAQGIGLHRRYLHSSRAITGQKNMKNYQLPWDFCIHRKYVWVIFLLIIYTIYENIKNKYSIFSRQLTCITTRKAGVD